MKVDDKHAKAQNGKHWHEGRESESTGETLNTFKMECGDRRVSLNLRAVIWLRQLEQGLRICESVEFGNLGSCESCEAESC